MEITSKTKVFGQYRNNYILTNEQEWDYETVDLRKIKGCKVNTEYKEISPYLPLSQYLNHNPYYMKPERQLNEKELEEMKSYERI